MRKMVVVAILAVGCIFCGCGTKQTKEITPEAEITYNEPEARVTKILSNSEYTCNNWYVLKDNETGICYLVVQYGSDVEIIKLEEKKEMK